MLSLKMVSVHFGHFSVADQGNDGEVLSSHVESRSRNVATLTGFLESPVPCVD